MLSDAQLRDLLVQRLDAGVLPIDVLMSTSRRWIARLDDEDIAEGETATRALRAGAQRIAAGIEALSGAHVWNGHECRRCGARRGWPLARAPCPA